MTPGRSFNKSHLASLDPLLRYLVGDYDRATALTQEGKDADELCYYLGIAVVVAGGITTAHADWQAVIVHPKWVEADGARRLLAWLDAGTPQLDKKVPMASDL